MLQFLASWIGSLARQKILANTIRTYVAGLRYFQIDLGIGNLDIFQHLSVKKMLIGLRRLEGKGNKYKQLLITKNILLRLLAELDTTEELQAMVHAAYYLAFAGFLRIREFTYLATDFNNTNFASWHMTRSSVNLQANRLLLSLSASKTNQSHKEVTLTIAAMSDRACAVFSLRNLFACFPKPATAPLFHSLIEPFTKKYLTVWLRSNVKKLGIKGNFSGHLFKKGAATSVKKIGLSKEEIQLLDC